MLFNLDQERDQRYKDLGLRDKITLTSGRFLMGNKYVILLPLLVNLLIFEKKKKMT